MNKPNTYTEAIFSRVHIASQRKNSAMLIYLLTAPMEFVAAPEWDNFVLSIYYPEWIARKEVQAGIRMAHRFFQGCPVAKNFLEEQTECLKRHLSTPLVTNTVKSQYIWA